MQKKGYIRHIGITNHRLGVAQEAISSGNFETLQFPFCYLATEKDLALVRLCKEKNMGFISMKALSGGLITNSAAAYAWQADFDHALPIWGVQREAELDQFLRYGASSNPPSTQDPAIQAVIEKDRAELTGSFCRSCGYCMPCPVGIQINQCARMSLMLRRMPAADYLTEYWQGEMKKVEDCLHCGQCAAKCPYSLDTPRLLQDNYREYWTYF